MAVAESGADALGLNFSELSQRQVGLAMAAEVSAAVAGRVLRIGLFVDPQPAWVEQTLERVDLDLLQFHGDESAAFCGAFGLPYMKAHRVADRLAIDTLSAAFPDACCHMLDAYVAGQSGGTGQRFDWSLWPERSNLRLVLAGGLTPENVAEAITVTRPWAVDVSGGVEGPRKGFKDADRLRRFVAAVRGAETSGGAELPAT